MSTNRRAVAKRQRVVPAGIFKATCLALLEEVARSGQVLVITKRGRPVAKVSPVNELPRKPLLGSVTFKEGILAPIDISWEVDT